MRKKSVLLYTLIALSISACSTAIVSDRYFVDRTVMLTDKVGNPIPPCNEDMISEGTLGAGTQQGMVVKPGDIVHLTIWSPGRHAQDTHSASHLTPPTFDILRLPIRKVFVPQEGADITEWFELSALNDTERIFLVNALTTNRKKNLGDDESKNWIETDLIKHEAKLWNALIDSLRIRRVDPTGYKSGCIYENGEISNQLNINDMYFLRKSTVSMTFDIAQLSEKLDGDDKTRFESAFEQKTSSDIVGFKELSSTPYSQFSGKGSIARNNSYYLNSSTTKARSFLNFVSVEVNGIDFRSQQMPERAWSLYSVEKSGICGDGAKIREFTFRNGRTFSVVNYSETAGYEVKRLNENRLDNVIENDNQPYQVGTQIGPKKKGLLSMFAASSLHRYDLSKIYISDVEQIVWKDIPEKRDVASLRARCLMD